jgi:hypothetical protein
MSLSPGVASAISRIEERNFTDSDVRTLLVGARGKCGSILQEFGDLVAHPERDRGSIHNHILLFHARMEMFLKYQGSEKRPIPIDGTCDWWLKPLLLHTARTAEKSQLKKRLGVIPVQLEREIEKFFPREAFPTRLALPIRPNEFNGRLFEIIKFCGSFIKVSPLFTEASLEAELSSLLEKYIGKIDARLKADLLACLLVLAHNSKYLLPNGTFGECTLRIHEQSFDNMSLDDVKLYIGLPHGKLSVFASAPVPSGPIKDQRVIQALLQTSLCSEIYFDPQLIKVDSSGCQKFDLDCNLKFEKTDAYPISGIKERN